MIASHLRHGNILPIGENYLACCRPFNVATAGMLTVGSKTVLDPRVSMPVVSTLNGLHQAEY